MGECLREENIEVDWFKHDYTALRDPFLQKIDGLIDKRVFGADQPLKRVIELTISCKKLVTETKQ